jgi:benzoate/toluate 1,2-dioxygenase beta subunit
VSAMAPPLSELREQVVAFIVREADLIDHHRYDEWLDLWSTDGIYWVPCNEDDYDPTRHVSIIYDDHERLQERVFRLSSDAAHSQDPPSRLCRIVGNEQISLSCDNHVQVRANMILVEVRSGEKNVYGARLEYTLVFSGEMLKIRKKKVILLDNNEPLGNLTFLL